MAKNVLLAFDKDKGIIKRLSKLSPKQHEKWILLPLLHDENIIRKIELYLKKQGCFVENLLDSEEINKTVFLLRRKYIHFIYEIGKKGLIGNISLKSWLKYPFTNFSLWWPSSVAEKNTVKSTAFFNLIKTFSTLSQIRKRQFRNVFLHLGNKAVLTTLIEWGKDNDLKFMDIGSKFNLSKGFPYYYFRAIRSFVIYINRILTINIKMLKSYKLRMQKLRAVEYLIITYFPLVDQMAIRKKQFVNRFFQPIQSALKKQESKHAWGAFFVPYDEYKLKETIELGKNINKWNETLFFLEEVLKPKDLISVIFIFHFIALKYLLVRRKMRRLFIFKNDEIKINSWSIMRNECDDSFCGSVLIFNLLHYRIFKKTFKNINKETKILYPAEWQSWEKALCGAAFETGRSKTVAIQHTAIPLLSLKFFFDKKEVESQYKKGGMPKPYKVGCVGNIPKKLLMESGWPDNDVFVLGGIRFTHYVRLMEKKISWLQKKNTIIVALSIHPKEAKEVISICLEAFNKEKEISVVFKGHPSTPVLSLFNSLKIDSLSPPFSISDTPLSDLLFDAKIIVVTESSATLEGLACYCQVVIPRLTTVLDLNPITGLTDFPIHVNSANELQRVSQKIMEQEDPPYKREHALSFLNQYITFHKRDEQYLESIESQFPSQKKNG